MHAMILHSFAYCLDYLREQVVDLEDSQMIAQPNGAVNHPAWTIGHIVVTCQMIGEVIDIRPWLASDWNAKFGSGSVHVCDSTRYPNKHTLLAAIADAQVRIARAVEALDYAALQQPFPDLAYRDVFPTVGHALTQVLVGHTANHVGQITTWRRSLGLPALRRSFE